VKLLNIITILNNFFRVLEKTVLNSLKLNYVSVKMV